VRAKPSAVGVGEALYSQALGADQPKLDLDRHPGAPSVDGPYEERSPRLIRSLPLHRPPRSALRRPGAVQPDGLRKEVEIEAAASLRRGCGRWGRRRRDRSAGVAGSPGPLASTAWRRCNRPAISRPAPRRRRHPTPPLPEGARQRATCSRFRSSRGESLALPELRPACSLNEKTSPAWSSARTTT
jgi:hypothetical protein